MHVDHRRGIHSSARRALSFTLHTRHHVSCGCCSLHDMLFEQRVPMIAHAAPADKRHRAAAPPSCNAHSAAVCRMESKYQALNRPGEGTLGVVCVGDVIEPQASDSVLRGHGTLLRSGSLVASRCGRVQRWNQLVLVEPLAGAYAAAVGHVVVGRIVQVRGLVHECEF
jgi:hypothetical protein